MQKRNLQTITFIGGEPTLHPDLPRIIKYIKEKKLLCQLLTNGLLFLQDAEDKLLSRTCEETIRPDFSEDVYKTVYVHMEEIQ